MRTMRWNVGAALLTAGVLTVAFASPAAASNAPLNATPDTTSLDPHWVPWLGCWSPAYGADVGGANDVCVVPAEHGSGVDVIYLGSSKPTETLSANEPTVVNDGGCSGEHVWHWSADGRRAYETTDLRCEGGTERHATAMLAFIDDSTWVWVHASDVGGVESATITGFDLASPFVAQSAGLAGRLSDHTLAAETARMSAGQPLSPDALAEASQVAGSKAVSLYLVSRRDTTHVDAKLLGELAERHVPADVINIMVALSYPTAFEITSSAKNVVLWEAPPAASTPTAYSEYPEGGGYSYPAPYLGLDGGFGYGYSPFGYGYSPYGYGYSPYGYGYAGYYGYGQYYPGGVLPPVIVVGPGGTTGTSGQVVSGRGYVRTTGTTVGQAHRRAAPSAAPRVRSMPAPRPMPSVWRAPMPSVQRAPMSRPAPAPASRPSGPPGRSAHPIGR